MSDFVEKDLTVGFVKTEKQTGVFNPLPKQLAGVDVEIWGL